MLTTLTLLILVICGLLVGLLLKLLKAPLRWFMKLLLNMAIGIVMLFVFNFIGGFFDFSLGINALNALASPPAARASMLSPSSTGPA